MVRFECKIDKSSSVYKVIQNAVDIYRKGTDEPFAVFGTLSLVKQEFIGAIVGGGDYKKVEAVLSEVMTETEVPKAPPTPVMTDKALGFTYGDMINAGWTNELLLEHGYIEDDIPW